MKERTAFKLFHCITSLVLFSLLHSHPALPREPERVQVTLDASEADQVLGILAKRFPFKPSPTLTGVRSLALNRIDALSFAKRQCIAPSPTRILRSLFSPKN